jgi:hypothetical protein
LQVKSLTWVRVVPAVLVAARAALLRVVGFKELAILETDGMKRSGEIDLDLVDVIGLS